MPTPETISVLLYDGFDELDALGPTEVLRAADRVDAPWSVDLVTVEECDHVTASYGTRIIPDGVLDPDDVDLLIVPGGGWTDRADRGAWAAAQAGTIPRIIAATSDAGAVVATVCTGGMLAAAAGLTAGRRAVTHHGAIESLADSGADIVDARVVDDGDLITAGGVTAGIDMALWLVERELGSDAASTIADFLEYERRGRVAKPPVD